LQQLEEKLRGLLQPQQQSFTLSSNPTAMIKLQRDFERVQSRAQQLQDMAKTKIASLQQQQQSSKMATSTNANNMPFFLNHDTNGTGDENDAVLRQYQQQQLLIQQEDRLQEEIMREREEEIRNINRGMHTVNEIYKDLAHIVSQQQHDIDTIETQMDQAHTSAQQGLQQVEKANEKYGQGNCTIM
jgi:syntaxin 7